VGQDAPHDVTALLLDWREGDEKALNRLMPLVYDQLHRLAAGYLAAERPDHTLQATALVNEAYLRMVDQRRVNWQCGAHFVALAANMMRRILVDHARGRKYAKRGGGAGKVTLDRLPDLPDERDRDVLEVDEAVTRLAELDEELGRIVELRFFGGLKSKEIAEVLSISVPTVTRRWRMARAWLHRYLKDEEPDGQGPLPSD
jgi:RNA polymerase sigma factor (TIGR02999 family)